MIREHSTGSRVYLAAWTCLCSCIAASSILWLGCSKPDSTSTSSSSTPQGIKEVDEVTEQGDPEELLRKVRGVYASATTYTDNATVVFYAVPRATGTERLIPFTESFIAFERPNLLHLTYSKNVASPQQENYELISDGLFVRSSAGELPDQIHEAIAPVRLSAENFIPEPALRGAILENSIENSLPQLAMLLSADSAQTVFPGEEKLRQLSDQDLDGATFHRLEWRGPAGKRVLWIDREQFTIRRMEIPIENQRKQLNAGDQFTTVSVWIDFDGVTIDADIASKVFAMDVPEGTRRVRRFIPAPPAAPPEYLGKRVGEFEFESLEGESLTPEILQGKVVLLDFWSTNCPPCRAQAPVLNEVYQHFRENEEVEFWAVSTDSRVVPNKQVVDTLASWGAEMPIVRDQNSSGYRDLNVRQTPTLVAIDRESRLQSFQIGSHRSAKPLIELIQRLVDGEDLGATERKKHAGFVAKYEEALQAAEIQDSIVEVEVVTPKVPERKLPEKLQLTQLWQSAETELVRPGALLLPESDAGGFGRLLVLDDGQVIVELDVDGKVAGRHEVPSHPERKGGFLRSWKNAMGETWTLASGAGWQQVYVFDKDWQKVLSFPDESHSGIGDVLFDDLTGSGTPVMYVGYWGGLGVQGGTLDGRRLWSNRRLDHVLQIGLGPSLASADESSSARRTTWCTSTRGTVMQMGADGKSNQERYIPGQALMYFASSPDQESHCGLAVGGAGEYSAVGFDDSDTTLWNYALPTGEYVEHLPRIQHVTMPDGTTAWLVVAANGSIHWLDLSGKLLDRFDYGAILTGLVMQRVEDQVLLLVSTADGVTAWQLEDVAEKSGETVPVDSEQSVQTEPASSEEL